MCEEIWLSRVWEEVWVEVWVEAVEREREQRRTHRPCEPAAPRATLWERGRVAVADACTTLWLWLCLACASRLHAHRVTAVHTQAVVVQPAVLPPPPLLLPLPPHTSSSITVLARCTTHCCREAKGTAHGFITDGRQGWRHARARPARPLARSLARSAMCGSQCCPLSHTQRSSAKLACLPITNHRRRPWVREACPLLCLTCSWRLLGASLDLAFARVLDIQCFYSASARDHQHCSRMPSAHICSSRAGQGRAWQGIAVIA